MEKAKNRYSNFELLRIIAIIIIILHHFAYHNSLYQLPTANSNFYIGLFLFSLGKIGVTVFIIISGYFMIDRKISIKKIIILWMEVEFYIILMTLITMFFKGTYTLGIKDTIKLLMPIIFNKYWFITAYMGLYILSPIINKILNGITQKQFKGLITVGFVLFIVLYSFVRSQQLITTANNLSVTILFIYIYMIGAYIKLYDINKLKNKSKLLLTLLLFLLFALYYAVLLAISFYFKQIEVAYYIDFKFIFVFLISILLFCIFKNINIKNNKIINWIASSVLGIYLFQSHPLFGGKYLYKELISSARYYNSKYLVLYILIVTVFIFVIGILIDNVRKVFERIICNSGAFDKFINCINEKLNKKIGVDYFEHYRKNS